jgi:hypothetical protein
LLKRAFFVLSGGQYEYEKEFLIITSLNTDPVIPWLSEFYAGTGQGSPRDPLCMMRSLLLMILLKENDISRISSLHFC